MTAAQDTQALADRAIVATYEKLHADKLGEHWLWCVIEQIAAGVPEAQAFKSYGYYEAGPSRARWDASRLQGQPALSDEQIVALVSPHLWFNDGPDGDNSTDDVLKAVRAVLAAGSQAVQMPGWRTIDSAPKDGSQIDVWIGDEREPDVFWGTPKLGHRVPCWCRHTYDPCWGWVPESVGTPSHWMPRPLQPLAGGEVQR